MSSDQTAAENFEHSMPDSTDGDDHGGPQGDAELHRIRHSLAHILALAVQEVRPGTKLGFGPPIADGFYYDFILPTPLTEDDFSEIEKRMKHLIKQGHVFEREELTREEAMKRLDDMGEPYKKQYAEELFEKKHLKTLSFFRSGKFVDMCEGPHVANTRNIPVDGFKLRSLAGAYWRGNSKNKMMTRVYAWAFKTKAELDAHVKAHKEALERDHKKLGKELDIFVIDDIIGKGLPLWLPNGTVIRDELEKLMRELEFKDGYQRVATPHMAKTSLYWTTGHLPYYAPHMYPFMELKESGEDAAAKPEAGADAAAPKGEVKESYCLKPMNCPHHHRVFAAKPHSYRDLPLRLAEYGQVYRFEDSGALSGLLRVRGMCMNDAHVYCTADQIKEEVRRVIAMSEKVYDILGLTNYRMRFSTWNPTDPKGKEKYVDNPAQWDFTQKLLQEVLVEGAYKHYDGPGEAAFYGPKIDFQFKTVTGREETASTVQVDFVMPERMDLKYTGADNMEHRPYVIHRAPLGTHERFVAFLIELYGGAFPTWLAPVQARVVTVSEKFNDYGQKIVDLLREKMVRAEIDASSDMMGKKIRNAAKQKIPNILVIGEREQLDGTITLRRHGKEEQVTLPIADFETWIEDQIKHRRR